MSTRASAALSTESGIGTDFGIDVEPLRSSAGLLGMGRSWSFPFSQWRANDAFRTVFFDSGQGTTLVFVHGLGGNITHFEPLLARLTGRYRLAGLDLVGCGWSRKPHWSYDLALLRDHLLSFLDQRGIGRVTLVGHSLGGAVCLAAALQRPGQVDGLVMLCGAGVAPLPRWMRLAGPVFLHRHLLLPTLVLGAEFIVRNVFVDSAEDNANVRWFRQTAMVDDPTYPNLRDFARVSESLCRDLLNHDFADQLATLPMPVLGIWGEQDKLTCVPSNIDHLRRIPRARTVILPSCGHMPMVERPEPTAFHLERFLHSPP
jgi:pimeloyl-ACP methyl ester carboxylesterase